MSEFLWFAKWQLFDCQWKHIDMEDFISLFCYTHNYLRFCITYGLGIWNWHVMENK